MTAVFNFFQDSVAKLNISQIVFHFFALEFNQCECFLWCGGSTVDEGLGKFMAQSDEFIVCELIPQHSLQHLAKLGKELWIVNCANRISGI